MAQSAKTEQIGVWIDESDKEDLDELAYRRRSSMSEIVRELIQDELEDAREDGEIDQ